MKRPWPRAPRAEEVVLIRRLAGGPRKIDEGPIGRCVKWGGCRVLVEPTADGKGTIILYDLTEAGREFL